MFQLLLESNPAPASRVGGSLFSTMGHVALVTAVVVLTAVPRGHPAEPNETRVAFVPVPSPAPETPRQDVITPNATAAPSALGTPTLPTVVDIPIGLPPIDLSLPVTSASDFNAGPRGLPDGVGAMIGTAGVSGTSGPLTADQVDKPVLLRPGARVPSYPEMLRSAGISGAVMVEFVVDTLGRIEAGTVKMVQADHDLFSSAVERIIPTLRFIPAEATGRKVRQLVRLPFRFDLHSDQGNASPD